MLARRFDELALELHAFLPIVKDVDRRHSDPVSCWNIIGGQQEGVRMDQQGSCSSSLRNSTINRTRRGAPGRLQGDCMCALRVAPKQACIYEQVVEAFKILTSDKQVKAILVNIFGARPGPPAVM